MGRRRRLGCSQAVHDDALPDEGSCLRMERRCDDSEARLSLAMAQATRAAVPPDGAVLAAHHAIAVFVHHPEEEHGIGVILRDISKSSEEKSKKRVLWTKACGNTGPAAPRLESPVVLTCAAPRRAKSAARQ